MKKLLVVLMVLSMATIANAALLISVNGTVDPPDTTVIVPVNSTVELDIWGDGLTPSNTDYYLIAEGSGTVAGGAMLYTGNLSSIGPASPGNIAVLQGLGYNPTTALYVVFGQLPPPPPVMAGVLVDEITFTCTGLLPPDSLVSLLSVVSVYDEENEQYITTATLMDSQIIHQIPEPFTMALLGLGGLFLRRRK